MLSLLVHVCVQTSQVADGEMKSPPFSPHEPSPPPTSPQDKTTGAVNGISRPAVAGATPSAASTPASGQPQQGYVQFDSSGVAQTPPQQQQQQQQQSSGGQSQTHGSQGHSLKIEKGWASFEDESQGNY